MTHSLWKEAELIVCVKMLSIYFDERAVYSKVSLLKRCLRKAKFYLLILTFEKQTARISNRHLKYGNQRSKGTTHSHTQEKNTK